MPNVRTQLRLPKELHKWVSQRAQREGRSMNREICRILETAKSGEEQDKKR